MHLGPILERFPVTAEQADVFQKQKWGKNFMSRNIPRKLQQSVYVLLVTFVNLTT